MGRASALRASETGPTPLNEPPGLRAAAPQRMRHSRLGRAPQPRMSCLIRAEYGESGSMTSAWSAPGSSVRAAGKTRENPISTMPSRSEERRVGGEGGTESEREHEEENMV